MLRPYIEMRYTMLRDLYHELIIDHGRHPRNFTVIDDANHSKEGFNPLCGDKIILYLNVNEKNNVIENIAFQGNGCAISIASASLMTEIIKGKTLAQAQQLFTNFHQLVTEKNATTNLENLGKLAVMSGVAEFPARVKCATLAWHTLLAALKNDSEL